MNAKRKAVSLMCILFIASSCAPVQHHTGKRPTSEARKRAHLTALSHHQQTHSKKQQTAERRQSPLESMPTQTAMTSMTGRPATAPGRKANISERQEQNDARKNESEADSVIGRRIDCKRPKSRAQRIRCSTQTDRRLLSGSSGTAANPDNTPERRKGEKGGPGFWDVLGTVLQAGSTALGAAVALDAASKGNVPAMQSGLRLFSAGMGSPMPNQLEEQIKRAKEEARRQEEKTRQVERRQAEENRQTASQRAEYRRQVEEQQQEATRGQRQERKRQQAEVRRRQEAKARPYGYYRHYQSAVAKQCVRSKRLTGGFNASDVRTRNICNRKIEVRAACLRSGGTQGYPFDGTYSFNNAWLKALGPGHEVPDPWAESCKGRIVRASCVAGYTPYFVNRDGRFVCLGPGS